MNHFELNGPKWNKISRLLKDRSSNSVKNRFLTLQRAVKREHYFDSINLSPIIASHSEIINQKLTPTILNQNITNNNISWVDFEFSQDLFTNFN